MIGIRAVCELGHSLMSTKRGVGGRERRVYQRHNKRDSIQHTGLVVWAQQKLIHFTAQCFSIYTPAHDKHKANRANPMKQIFTLRRKANRKFWTVCSLIATPFKILKSNVWKPILICKRCAGYVLLALEARIERDPKHTRLEIKRTLFNWTKHTHLSSNSKAFF